MNGATLPQQGYRYLITEDCQRYGWIHPAEVPERLTSGWVDVTDLTDDELVEFVKAAKAV
jgi:hypothetical protein